MKTKFFAVAAVAALFAASCTEAQLDNVAAAGQEVTVSFVANAPEAIATKAFSDGDTAKNLQYAVYAENSQTPIYEGTETFENLKATVNLTLVTGKTYDLVFWAQAEGAPYKFNSMTQTVTVDYSNVSANDETLDAFYKTVAKYQVVGANTETVQLRRPFAQINVGTSDEAIAKANGVEVLESKMVVKNVYTSLNLFDGEVSNPQEVTFAYAAIPSGDNDKITIAGKEYGYMEMNYILVDSDKETTELSFYLQTNEHVIDYVLSNVPVQRNYRTNIYGALLTNPTVWNVEIKPAYEEPAYGVEVWTGELEEVTPETETDENGEVVNVYEVSSGAELAWIAGQLNSGVDFAGATIRLTDDIALGAAWEPINLWGPEKKTVAVIDGAGHKISNLNVNGAGSLGFIGSYASSSVLTIKNLTFENPVVESSASFVGTVVGYTYGNITLDNVKVTGAEISTSAEKGIRLGGLVGLYPADAVQPLVLNGCVVENSTIKGYHNLAGLVGSTMGSDAKFTNCQSNNNSFYPGAANAAAWQNFDANGYAEGKAVKEGCTTEGNKRVEEVAGNDEIGNAIVSGASEIVLAEGTYTVPASAQGKEVTFVGTGNPENTVIKCSAGSKVLENSDVAFENVTIETANGNYQGFMHVEKAVYKNCIIKSQYTLYGPSEFIDCTFEVKGNQYNIWTYGFEATFTNCTFNCGGKAVLVYNERANTDDTVTFNNCTFNDNGELDVTKAAIEAAANQATVKHTIIINKCTVNGFAVTGQETTVHNGTDLGTNVWGNKNLMTAENLKVVIDGTEVY